MNHPLEIHIFLDCKGNTDDEYSLENTLLSQITVVNELPFCQLTHLGQDFQEGISGCDPSYWGQPSFSSICTHTHGVGGPSLIDIQNTT